MMAVGSDVRMWATAISTNKDNGRKIIFRYAKDFSPTFRRDSQPIRVIIVWKYQSETGQPSREGQEGMNLLEDALESVLKDDSFATLALVSTGENFREWIYYAKSETEFQARFDYALDGMPAFPIEIHTASDPTWETYERFKSGLKNRDPSFGRNIALIFRSVSKAANVNGIKRSRNLSDIACLRKPCCIALRCSRAEWYPRGPLTTLPTLLNHRNRVLRLLLTSLLTAATSWSKAQAQSPPTGWVIYPMPESNSSVMQCANYSGLEWRVSLSEAGTAQIVPRPKPYGAGSSKLPAGVKRQKGMIGAESTLKLKNGWLLGFDAGEFGGGLWFADVDGKTQELSNENVRGFVETQQFVLVFVGLAHMGLDSGKVLIVPYKITAQTDLRTLGELDGAPEAVSKQSDDTALVITTQSISQIASSGVSKTLLHRRFSGLYPNSIVSASDSAIYAGMRLFVVRLVPQSGEYTEQWLIPDNCKHFRVRDLQCVCRK